jgi:hypothetical protein
MPDLRTTRVHLRVPPRLDAAPSRSTAGPSAPHDLCRRKQDCPLPGTERADEDCMLEGPDGDAA